MLGKSLQNLKHLLLISLSFNNITELTSEHIPLFELSADVDVSNNNFQPPSLRNMSKSEILQYLLRLQQEGSERVYHARLVVVGWTGVGKTTLIHRMLGKSLPPLEQQKRTLGIVLQPWTLPIPVNGSSVDVNVSIWDFAGQMDFYPLHQQFLIDDGTFCMVVFNSSDAPEKSSNEIKEWLSILRNGPLRNSGLLPLLVGTHRIGSSELVVKDTLKE